MPDSKISSPQGGFWRERFYSLKTIGWMGKTIAVAITGWLFSLGAYEAALFDWLPPQYSSWLPKPYQVLYVIRSYLNSEFIFLSAAVILWMGSFEHYHRSRLGKKSVTPMLLLGAGVISLLLYITSSSKDSSLKIQSILDMQQPQAGELASLKVNLEKLKDSIRLQIRIANDIINIGKVTANMETLNRYYDGYEQSCLSVIPQQSKFIPLRPAVTIETMRAMSEFEGKEANLRRLMAQVSAEEKLPNPPLDGAGGRDTNKPAPGQEKFDTDEQKYYFRIAYWTCISKSAAIQDFISAVAAKLAMLSSDKSESEVLFRSSGL